MAQRLGDHRLAHADGAVEDHRLPGLEEAQRGEVPDDRGRDARVEAEVVLLERHRALEPGRVDPAHERRRVPAGDLVLAQRLEELQVAEVPAVGLGEARVEGVQHPRQAQRTERGRELMRPGHADASPSSASPSRSSKRPCEPRRCAGTDTIVVVIAVPSCSVPAARMPLTVR